MFSFKPDFLSGPGPDWLLIEARLSNLHEHDTTLVILQILVFFWSVSSSFYVLTYENVRVVGFGMTAQRKQVKPHLTCF